MRGEFAPIRRASEAGRQLESGTLASALGRAPASCGFLGGQNGFVERAIREANATLESLAERAGSFKHNRNIKVSW